MWPFYILVGFIFIFDIFILLFDIHLSQFSEHLVALISIVISVYCMTCSIVIYRLFDAGDHDRLYVNLVCSGYSC